VAIAFRRCARLKGLSGLCRLLLPNLVLRGSFQVIDHVELAGGFGRFKRGKKFLELRCGVNRALINA